MARIIIFDVETTGTNTDRDQVIELCIQEGLDADTAKSQTWRFKPSIPVPPQAQKIHGISDEDLKNCKPFSAYAKEVRELLQGAEVLVGYNLSFDLGMIQAELARHKQPLLDLNSICLVDPYQIWRKFEPRDLGAAHQRFVGQKFDGAHSATEDVAATGRVLEGMLSAFKINDRKVKDQDWTKIAAICDLNASRKTWVGPTNHFRWEEQTVVFGFGKHRNRTLSEVAQEDNGGYLNWLVSKDFPDHVKQIAKAAAQKNSEELLVWVKQTFG